MEELYITADDFLRLFSVDTESIGARDFINLTEMYSVCLLFPELQVNKRLLVKAMLRKYRVSPLVYWSRMKRPLMPVLSADSDTLDALGCSLPDERSCPALVDALAAAIAGNYDMSQREKYREVAVLIKKMCSE